MESHIGPGIPHRSWNPTFLLESHISHGIPHFSWNLTLLLESHVVPGIPHHSWNPTSALESQHRAKGKRSWVWGPTIGHQWLQNNQQVLKKEKFSIVSSSTETDFHVILVKNKRKGKKIIQRKKEAASRMPGHRVMVKHSNDQGEKLLCSALCPNHQTAKSLN